MQFDIQDDVDSTVDLVVVGIPEGSQECEPQFRKLAEPLFKSGDLPLKPLETFILPGSPRIMFIGLSKAANAEAWRRAASTVVRRVKKGKRIAFVGGDSRAIAEGATIGSFSVEQYKTANNKSQVESIVLIGGQSNGAQHGRILGESTNWARELINTPSNDKPPRVIADRAQEMARSVGLEVDVLDETRIR